MTDTSGIKVDMEVVGADGGHIGTVAVVEAHRIKLITADSGEGVHMGHQHYIGFTRVSGVEGNKVRLFANAAVAIKAEE